MLIAIMKGLTACGILLVMLAAIWLGAEFGLELWRRFRGEES